MQFSLTGHVCLQTKLNLTKMKLIWARKMQRASSPIKETCSSTSQTAFFYSPCQRSVPVPLSNNLLYTQPRDAQSHQPILTNSPVFCIAWGKAAAVILKAGSSPTELNVKRSIHIYSQRNIVIQVKFGPRCCLIPWWFKTEAQGVHRKWGIRVGLS